MNFMEKHLDNIIKANNDNRLAIFIGAGISKSSGSITVKLPSWDELIEDLKKDLGLINEENDFLKIAQLYFLEFKEFTYYEKLKSYFPNNIEPSLIHELIFDINPQCLITTNWDTILEKAIENNAYIYDVISSDEDLVKSTLQKKLIKMHGDFKKHNIVFKEDDFLNYQHKFPLIENYIKSILSTHTVLFIGYSYNDINLKHIMKWLQNHSKVSPPRYLISFEQNSTQEKYLENHGITALMLNDDKLFRLSKDYKKYDNLDSDSKKMAIFLDLLSNPDSINSIQNDDDIVDYIYNKLKRLNDLDGILLDQIRNTLTNCGFIYTDDNIVLLKFYSNILTADLNKNERLIHEKFVSLLNKYDKGKYKNNKIEKIFNILVKANISGIVISKEEKSNNIEYVNINDFINNPDLQDITDICFDFSFTDSYEKTNNINKMADYAYHYYQNKNFNNAYNISEEVINLCLKLRNYTQLFLSMSNRNNLLPILKYSLHDKRDQYKNHKEYDLKEKFNNLPKDIQKTLEPIFYFVNRDYLYRFAFHVSSELEDKESSKRTIEQGGVIFSRNITESSSKHKNLVLFLLKNKIMAEHFNEYKTINKYFVEIAIIRQVQYEHIWLNKIELYSCIKYISHKELLLIFKNFYANETGKETILKISENDKKWLIEKVLPNLGKLFIETDNSSNNHEEYLENAIFILALIDMDKEQTEKIMALFLSIISKARNTINIYKSINDFLGIQYKLFKREINDDALIKLIEVIITKLVYKKYNAFDYFAITSNAIDNLYGYVEENKTILNNKELVSRLLSELKDHDTKDKISIAQSLLFSIYDISNEDIRNNIKSFILDIDIQSCNDTEDAMIFELSLVIRKFKEYDDRIINKLNQYLKQFEDGKKFSSVLYTLKNQLDYLVNEMLYHQLKDTLEEIDRDVEIYETRKRISIF